MIEHVPVKALLPYLNEQMLYQFHWGYEKQGRRLEEFLDWAHKELRPVLAVSSPEAEQEHDLHARRRPTATSRRPARATTSSCSTRPGQGARPLRAAAAGTRTAACASPTSCATSTSRERDVLGLQVVTVGQRASEVARDWFAADRYQDYVRLHGLGVELAEALAEYVHAKIRAELGFGHQDARDMRASCSSRAIAARATASATRPARTWPTRRRCWSCWAPTGSASSSARSDQLWPEQSTSAIVLHHPQARYFNV